MCCMPATSNLLHELAQRPLGFSLATTKRPCPVHLAIGDRIPAGVRAQFPGVAALPQMAPHWSSVVRTPTVGHVAESHGGYRTIQ